MLFSAIRVFKKLISKKITLEHVITIALTKIKIFEKLLFIIKVHNYALKKQLTYTISRYDGFGAQYFRIIGGIAVCELMNYKYIHTSFQDTGFDYDDRDIDRFNEFVGIPVERKVEDFLVTTRITKDDEDIDKFSEFVGIPIERKVENSVITMRITKDEDIDIIVMENWIFRNLKNPARLFTKRVLNKVKNYYYSTPKPIIKKYDIAIHIRRGDVDAFNIHNFRFTPNERYVPIVKFFKEKYPNHSLCIYSQGKIEDFQELQMPGVFFDLNSETTEVFHSLVHAKILVISKSHLSYTAALLSDNIIYFIPPFRYYYYPMKHWRAIFR
jgi:hypothetical protein